MKASIIAMTLAAALFPGSRIARADVTLPAHFTSGMVLQRGLPLPISGHAEPGESVTISFGDQTLQTIAGADGSWRVELQPLNANATPEPLIARGKNELRLENVLVGDVWLASGQSNMEWNVRQAPHLAEELKDFTKPSIRLLFVERILADQPAADISAKRGWREACGEDLQKFSAVGTVFARRLHQELGVPIGIVLAAFGGSRIEPWLSPDTWNSLPSAGKVEAITGKQPISSLYNGMIHPLVHFPIKGVIWYQGESSARWWPRYPIQFPELIKSWRAEWGIGDFPFLFVQIAPFKAVDGDISPERWAWMREAQTSGLSQPATGMVVTTDLGEYESIHPLDKAPVGERLAQLALQAEGLAKDADSPSYASMSVKQDRVELQFQNIGEGLKTGRVALNHAGNLPPGSDPGAAIAPADRICGFQIAGEDQRFSDAEATIEGSGSHTRVIVHSTAVPKPVAVRYGWANFPLCNLYGCNGLPLAPFRTDHFAPPDFGQVQHP